VAFFLQISGFSAYSKARHRNITADALSSRTAYLIQSGVPQASSKVTIGLPGMRFVWGKLGANSDIWL
jgi:hypothetical protein